MTTTVIVPVFNEETTIGPVVDALLALDLDTEIIVVDDGSLDSTADVLRAHPGDIVIEHLPANQGKGAAIRRGIELSTGEVVVVQDADLELSVDTIIDLVAPVLAGTADAAYGSRFLVAGQNVPLARRIVNRYLTGLTNRIYGLRLTDVMTAHKAVRGELLRSLDLRTSGFEIEVELTAKLARCGARIVELPSPYDPRTKSEGKKIRWTDTWPVSRAALRYRRWPAAVLDTTGD